MCILLKLHYNAKFDVSRWFCLKVIKEKPLGGRLDPLHWMKEGLNYGKNKGMISIFFSSIVTYKCLPASLQGFKKNL